MRRITILVGVFFPAIVGSPFAALAYTPNNPNDPHPPSPWTRDHVKVVYGLAGMVVVNEIDGKQCVETTGKLNCRCISFDVDDSYAFDINETVEIEIEYDATLTKQFRIEYDSHDPKAKHQGAHRAIEATMPASPQRWASYTFKLEQARFTNRQGAGADFLVTTPNGLMRISDLKIRRPVQPVDTSKFGTLKLRIIDGSTGQPTPARLGLYNDKGRFQMPNEKALPINVFYRTVRMYSCRIDFSWPVNNSYIFYADGEYECTLPAGQYELVVRKGIEYHMVHEKLTIEAGKALEHTVTLTRWADMPAKGWYSGDPHVHIGRTPEQNPAIMAHMQAEDVHVANLVQMGNIHDNYFRQYAWGAEGRYQQGNYYLIGGHEDPRTPSRGHTLFLNLTSMVRDDETYYLYHKVFEKVRQQGGLVGYAHVGWGFYAHRGLALDIPFDLVDFAEILQGYNLHTWAWYDLLNLGYKLVPSAGSDFPYIDPPGAVRNYVLVEGPFSAQAWFDNFDKGYTFVTSGPMLTLAINGRPMGSELTAKRGEALTIEASASINPDIDELASVELIVHGDTVKKVEAQDGQQPLVLEHTMTADHSMWIAIKAEGKKKAVAHSAPIYVIVNGQRFWKVPVVAELIAKQRQHLKELLDEPPKSVFETWIQKDLEEKWAQQKPLIEQRAQRANVRYDEMLKALEKQ